MKNTSKIMKITLDGNFTQIPNELLQSTELTCEEVYLIANLCSRPEGWVFNKTQYWRQTTLGRGRFNKAWKGLQDKGYIESVRRIQDNLIVGYDYKISYLPIFGVTEIRITEASDDRETERPRNGEHIKTDNINKDNINKEVNKEIYIPSTNNLEADKFEDIIYYNKSITQSQKIKLFDSFLSDI
jgi:hypothetical protein